MSKQNTTQSSVADKAEVIYLGIDTHAKTQVVVRQTEQQAPQPAQKFATEAFVAWARKQLALAKRVVCCYEAGCTGYGLYRQLRGLGIECHVVRARDWDEHGERVKTDGRDARALCEALERYDRGNQRALGIVRVPTEQEELARSHARQRAGLQKELQRLAAIGRSTALNYSHPIKGDWWKPRAWKRLGTQLPAWLIELLAPWQKVAAMIDEQHAEKKAQIEAQASPAEQRPKGLGAMSEVDLLREVCDWRRFNNRGQVSSYTGLCPSEHSSGGKRRQGGINKHGNPVMRKVLIEATWRLVQWQPDWYRLKKLLGKLVQSGKTKLGKKNIVALARGLAVDLWRVFTGRTTLSALGMQPA
jgi:transposase